MVVGDQVDKESSTMVGTTISRKIGAESGCQCIYCRCCRVVGCDFPPLFFARFGYNFGHFQEIAEVQVQAVGKNRQSQEHLRALSPPSIRWPYLGGAVYLVDTIYISGKKLFIYIYLKQSCAQIEFISAT